MDYFCPSRHAHPQNDVRGGFFYAGVGSEIFTLAQIKIKSSGLVEGT
jgi:hypothetical protein